MAAYHVVMVHFPIALWLVAGLAIFIRGVSAGAIGQSFDKALPTLLVGGLIFGAVAWGLGLSVWPWETLSATPMGRNHMLLASWSWAYFALLTWLRLRHGAAIWQGLNRLLMVGLAGIGVAFVGITGTLGGHLVGNYTEVGQVLRLLGWEIYTTFYVPDLALWVIVAVSVVLLALGVLGRGGPRKAG